MSSILIDAGYAATFHDYILPDLKHLAQNNYSLDLIVSTHIDADHISGLLSFFKENRQSKFPQLIPVKEVWHNSLRSLSFPAATESDINQDDRDLLVEICQRGYPLPQKTTEALPEEISARQGSSLASLLLEGGYRWNTGDGTRSISLDISHYEIHKDLQLRVIGPPVSRLERLSLQWITELRRLGFVGQIKANNMFSDAFEFSSAFEDHHAGENIAPKELCSAASNSLEDTYLADNSVTNGSSIALIIESCAKRLLFLGDSWAEDIENALKAIPNSTFPLIFDMIKISHHGSLHNTSPSLLKLIDSRIYLFSTNGDSHNHPSFEVLKAIVDRPSKFKRSLHF